MRLRGTKLSAYGSAGKGLWTPRQIPTVLWFDAADSSTITLNGSTISQWSDKSGNNNHATQPTAAEQPTYNAAYTGPATPPTGTPIPAVVTSGAQKFITPLTLDTLPSFTIIMVAARSGNLAPGVNSALAGTAGPTSATPTKLQFTTSTSETVLQSAGRSQAQTPASAAVPFNTFAIPGMSWNGSTANAAMNGVETANSSAPFTAGFDNTPLLLLGSTNLTRGLVGATLEFVMTPTVATTSDRQKIEGYLAWKWGLQTSLPVSHPYYSSPPVV